MSTAFHFLGIRRNQENQILESLALKHQQFDSIETMDNHLRIFVEINCLRLSDNTLMVLEILARHSLKVFGVSWLSIRTLSNLIGVCERTIQRILKQLEELGIIRRIGTPTKFGGRGVNLVVIQPLNEDIVLSQKEVKAGAVEVCVSTLEDDVTRVATEHVHNKSGEIINLSCSKSYIFEEEEYLPFEYQISKYHITPDLKQFILDQIGDIRKYSGKAIERTFKKAMLRIRLGTGLYNPPKWIATTLRNEQFYLDQKSTLI